MDRDAVGQFHAFVLEGLIGHDGHFLHALGGKLRENTRHGHFAVYRLATGH